MRPILLLLSLIALAAAPMGARAATEGTCACKCASGRDGGDLTAKAKDLKTTADQCPPPAKGSGPQCHGTVPSDGGKFKSFPGFYKDCVFTPSK